MQSEVRQNGSEPLNKRRHFNIDAVDRGEKRRRLAFLVPSTVSIILMYTPSDLGRCHVRDAKGLEETCPEYLG
jgi:hypothetical protein